MSLPPAPRPPGDRVRPAPDELITEEHVLESRKYGCALGVSKEVMEHARFDVVEEVFGKLVFQFATHVLVDAVDDVSQPIVFEHLKAAHPRIFGFLRPPRTVTTRVIKTATWERGLAFPQAKVYPEFLGRPFRYVVPNPGFFLSR